MGQKKLLGGFRGVKFTIKCSLLDLYLLLSHVISAFFSTLIRGRKTEQDGLVSCKPQQCQVTANCTLFSNYNASVENRAIK